MLAVRQADPKIDTARRANLIAEYRAQSAARRALHDFSGDVAPSEGMIAALCAGRPHRFQRRDRRRAFARLEPKRRVNRIDEARHTGLMAHDLGDGQLVFAMRAEFRPKFDDGIVVAEQSLLHAPCNDDRGDPFGGGINRRQRFARPRFRFCAVREAAPDVDERLALTDRGEARAYFFARVEICAERIGHWLETWRDEALNVDHHISSRFAVGHVTGSASKSCAPGNSRSSLSAASERTITS